MSDILVGYVACFVAIFFFGSNFAPLKRVDLGDGVFMQFIMCCAIFMTSLPVLLVQGFPPFHGFAMLGGALWCTGNMMCGPIINKIGMGMGILVWGSTNMLMGWASGTFGLFGLTKDEIVTPALNYCGVALALAGLIVFLQVKPNDMSDARVRLSTEEIQEFLLPSALPISDDKHAPPKKEGLTRNHVIGFAMALLAGALFGCSFTPSQYIIDSKYDGDDDSLNYVFSHFTGILFASWCYLLLYFVIKHVNKRTPYVNAACIVPATLSGIMWGIACISWFVANGRLGFSVTFPVITSAPGFIASLYGIFLFREISGQRNYTLLVIAFVITVTGLIMVSLSH